MPFDIAANLPDDPFAAFAAWYAEAEKIDCAFPNAMTLASCSDNRPSARVVLLKSWDEQGFVFFTNYQSRKGEDLAANPRASLLFYWDALFRQVRIEGKVETINREESRAYFDSRPRDSRIGAWASHQSRELESREILDERVEHYRREFEGGEPDLPDYWGGYLLRPLEIEFWHGEYARLHQRRSFSRDSLDVEWKSRLLYP